MIKWVFEFVIHRLKGICRGGGGDDRSVVKHKCQLLAFRLELVERIADVRLRCKRHRRRCDVRRHDGTKLKISEAVDNRLDVHDATEVGTLRFNERKSNMRGVPNAVEAHLDTP